MIPQQKVYSSSFWTAVSETAKNTWLWLWFGPKITAVSLHWRYRSETFSGSGSVQLKWKNEFSKTNNSWFEFSPTRHSWNLSFFMTHWILTAIFSFFLLFSFFFPFFFLSFALGLETQFTLFDELFTKDGSGYLDLARQWCGYLRYPRYSVPT